MSMYIEADCKLNLHLHLQRLLHLENVYDLILHSFSNIKPLRV